MPIDYNTLFEQLDRLIDKPHDYNSLISKLFAFVSQSQINFVDGVPYIFDPDRQKNLSLTRPVITSAYYGQNQNSRYLRLDGVTCSGNGFLIPRKGTITALWAKSRSINSWEIQLRKNDVPISIASASIVSGVGTEATLDIDVDEGDYLQLFLNGTGIDHPIACFEMAWRS